MDKKVVITGIGLISPLGNSLSEIFDRIARKENVFRTPESFSSNIVKNFQIAEIRDFDPIVYGIDQKNLRIMSRDAIFASAAARLALKDSKLTIGNEYKPEEIALFGATGLSGIAFKEVKVLLKNAATPEGEFDLKLFGTVALKKVPPTLSFKILTNMPICFVSIGEGIQGMNAVYNPWEGQGAQAIVAGIHSILDGDASCALVGGCDEKTNLLGFISLCQHGFIPISGSPLRHWPAEGAAFLVLEKASRAKARKARIYAQIDYFDLFTKNFKNSTSSFNKEVFAGVKRVLNSTAETSPEFEMEREFLDFTGIQNAEMFSPKNFLGDSFAASAATQVAIGAYLVSQARTPERILATCFGFGSEKGYFVLGNENSELAPLPVSISSSEQNRVVVTGLGIVSPIGNDCRSFWKNLVEGKCGIKRISLFDTSALSVQIGGEVTNFNFDKVKSAFPNTKRERDRKIFFGLWAAQEALSNAGFDLASQNSKDFLKKASLHIGVSLEVFFLEDVTPVVHEKDLGNSLITELLEKRNNASEPFTLQTPLDRLAQILGDAYGIDGGRYTICSACAAGAQVIGEAFRMLRRGSREITVVGAADSMLNPLGLGGFSLLRALSTENDQPEKACRPFDATRAGAVLGEGAAFLVLETVQSAKKRGAKIYAEVLGYGSSLDAYRVSDPEPSGKGATLSMKKALSDAGLSPEKIDCINAHGTGTRKNDVVETLAIKDTLGDHSRKIPIHSVKSMTGHLIGASGAVEAVAAILTLINQTVPPTINLHNPDPECDLDYVPNTARKFLGKTVLSNSFGFGGQNATLIFGRYEE